MKIWCKDGKSALKDAAAFTYRLRYGAIMSDVSPSFDLQRKYLGTADVLHSVTSPFFSCLTHDDSKELIQRQGLAPHIHGLISSSRRSLEMHLVA